MSLYQLYEADKQAWALANPNATPQEYEAAMQAIAKQAGI